MKKLMLFFALFTIVSMQIYAQKTITGTVTDSDGGKLPGVTVSVKATTVSTMTGNDGAYTINAPEGANALIFSYMGMKRQEIAIAGNVINAVMQIDDTEVEVVVVTALGVSRDKKSLGYSVQEVGGDELNRSKNTNVINSISGKVAGIQIKNNSNMGGSSNILIRGSSSLTGNNQALFVIDGVPISNMNTNDAGQKTGRSGYDYGNPVSDINPNDIESVNVLKGAAATALYGSRAANGVIVITTKKGKKGKNNVTVSVNHSSMFHTIDKNTMPIHQQQYGAGYGPYYSGGDIPHLAEFDFDGDGVNDYVVPSTEDASQGAKFDPSLMVFQWDAYYPGSINYNKKSPFVAGANGIDYFFKTGRTISNNIDISGGTEVSTVRLSYTNTDQTGIMPNSSIKKNNVTFSGSYDLSDKITISASANYINAKAIGRNHTGYSDNIMSSFRQWYNVGVDMKLQEDYYNSLGINATWNPHSKSNTSPEYWDNPYWSRYENYQSDERNRLIGYTKFDWKLTKNLSFMGRYSVDYYGTTQEERKAIGSVSGEFGVGRPDVRSGYARTSISFMETNFDAILKYNKNLTEDLNLNAFLGSNIRRTNVDQVYASTNGGLAVPEVFALSNSASPMLPPSERATAVGVNGYFASASVGFKNTLFVDGTYRYDISSTLPSNNRAFGYWGASTSLLFSEMIKADWLSLGKLRLSYAQVGNDAPWGSVSDSYRIVSPYNGNTMVRFPSFKNNPDLLPEISGSFETGLEMSMLKNRIGIDFAFYKTNTKNAVVPLSTSFATGYSSKYVNIGEMENKGFEVMFRVTPLRNRNLSWDIAINWAKNINKVVSLGGDIKNLQIASLQGGVTINAREGEAYGSIQGTDFVYAPDGQKVINGYGYYEKTATSDELIGNVQPDWTGGITNSINYKGFSFSFLIDMQMGGSIFSLDQWYGQGTGLYPNTVANNNLGNPLRDPIVQNDDDTYASNSGGILLEGVVGEDTNGDGEYDTFTPNTTRIRGDKYTAFGWSKSPNSRYVYDATYVKLREVSLGYTLPKSMLQKTFISSATISIVGSNLHILYKALPYADPEASQGAGNVQGWQSGVFPTTRNYGFSLNLTF